MLGRSAMFARRCLSSTEAAAAKAEAPKEWSLKEFLGRNRQGLFNIGVSFGVTVLASQVLSAKQLREELISELDAANGELQAVRARVALRRRSASTRWGPGGASVLPAQATDAPSLKSIAGRLGCDAGKLEREIKLVLDPAPVEPAPPAAPPSIV